MTSCQLISINYLLNLFYINYLSRIYCLEGPVVDLGCTKPGFFYLNILVRRIRH